jgi:ubiquinone/menaquinone biosynthesis C-methylase UbiE
VQKENMMLRNSNDARFWDRIARKYANDKIKDMAGYERTIERTRQLLRSADNVLEIGCGTGTTALALAPYVSRISASDASSEMITIAREKAAAQSCQNAEFAVATAGHVPGPDGARDAVLAFNVLHLIGDRASALAQIERQLKPGGLFISKTPCLSEMNPMIRYAVPVAQIFGKAPFVSFFTATKLEAEIKAAGFAIIARERHGSERKDPRIFIVAQKPDQR